MEDYLRSIAEENVTNTRKAGIAAIIMAVLTIPMWIMVLSTEFQNIYWIIGTTLAFVVGSLVSWYYQKKVVGKKSAVDIELERLEALHPEEKLKLHEIDETELELREMVRRSNTNDMV